MKYDGDYYIGLDCGTESVGFAVTDTEYNVLRFKGKSMWGSHLFDEAKTAADRRTFRASRRRNMRRKERIRILQGLFSEAIDKVDPEFFIRLNDSAYLREDKHINQPNALFNDKDFTDKDYYRLFPTIYHLRKALIDGKAPHDPRLLYLALHHILKNRGHFLYEGRDMQSVMDITPLLSDISDTVYAITDKELAFHSADAVENALRIKRKSDRVDALAELMDYPEKELRTLMSKAIVGYKVRADKLFGNEEYSELPAVEFNAALFEEKSLPELEDALDDDEFRLILLLKGLSDWSLLASVLDGYSGISEAKIAQYDKNREDLQKLKKAIRLHAPSEYHNFFHNGDKDNKGSFSSYIGCIHDDGRRKSVRKSGRPDEFYARIRKLIGPDPADHESIDILNAISEGNFMPLLSSFHNGVIPYQVHKMEMDRILDRNKECFPFLSEKDADGLSVIDKLDSLLEYRIPYYVGPLGRNTQGQSGWMVRKEEGRILPWNFFDKVDEDASEENFIKRMSSKCTYLHDEDVLPKNSLLYSSFMVLNELNNVRVDGQRLPVEQKQCIFLDLFMKARKVTKSRFRQFLISEGWVSRNAKTEITGIDSDFKSSLGSFIDFEPYIGTEKLSYKDAEDIIRWLTIFSEGGRAAERRISKAFGKRIASDSIRKISRLKYSGWGRLSGRFLNGIEGFDKSTGEVRTIIEALWSTQNNLMELLGDGFDYSSALGDGTKISKLEYSVVDDLYVSPSVKRQIWQTLRVVDEIVHIMKRPPKRIFVEVARENQAQGKRTKSRKDRLLEAYREFGNDDEIREMISVIESIDESAFAKRDKLFLYFTQLGKSMYSGKPMNIEEIGNTHEYDVDHIYPYSRSDDDSLDNRVLVYQTENREKSDDYPLSDSIRKEMAGFWKKLRDMDLISSRKYERLMRNTPLDEEDEKGFISRQLVETSQSTKATIGILRRYFDDSTAVVFSKAGKVSEFRASYGFSKSRTVNCLHHAKDAYLNIVVGNVLRTKYTSDFFAHRVQAASGYYNISRPFDFDVKGAWIAGENGSIKTVRRQMDKNDILFTRQPIARSGGFFDQMPVAGGGSLIPRKSSDPRLLKRIDESNNQERTIAEWTAAYGGYNKPLVTYFALVSYTDKKKRVLRFIPISLIDSPRLSDKGELEAYCRVELKLDDPKVIRQKVLINTMISVNGYKCTISGSSSGGKSFLVASAVPLIISNDEIRYIHRIEKFFERRKQNRNITINPEYDGITPEGNLAIYDMLSGKAEARVYQARPSGQASVIKAGRDKFIGLPIDEQCSVLMNLISYFGMGTGVTDLKLIGGKGKAGLLNFSSKIDPERMRLEIHDQSVTGLFEKREELRP